MGSPQETIGATSSSGESATSSPVDAPAGIDSETTPASLDISHLSREEIAQIVMGGFQGSITKHRASGQYQLARWLASAQCLLVPLLPVTLFVIFGFTCDLLDGDNNSVARKILEATIAFFALEIFFSVLVFILFIVRQRAQRPFPYRYSRKITPEDEPLLWDFVIRVADTVGAPHPSEIEIDCDPNAAAAKVIDARGVHTRQDALLLGLPLAMGMSVEQLAGVIAHELGHFSQRKDNFLLYWLDIFIGELFGYADRRERLDHAIFESVRYYYGRNSRMPPHLIPAVVFVFRSIYAMACTSALVHHYWRRQSEYDADQYEIRLVGSVVFEQARKRIATIWCGFDKAFDDARRFCHEGRLPDNFPKLFEAAMKSIHPKEQEEAEKKLLEEKAKKEDSHPSPSDRIAVAKQTQTAAVYHCNLSASVLFHGGKDTSRDATLEFYRKHIDNSISAVDLNPSESLLAEREKERMRKHATLDFGLGADVSNRPPPVTALRLATSSPQALSLSEFIEELESARRAMQESAASYDSNFEQWRSANCDVWAGTTAELMMKGGVRRLADSLIEFNGKPQLAKERAESGKAQAEQLNKSLLQFEAGVALRWQKAVEILAHPDVQSRVPDAADKLEHAKDILRLVAALHSNHDQRCNLFQSVGTTGLFLRVKRDTSLTWKTIYERLEHTISEHESILSHFEGCKYPFPHNRPSLTVQEYLTPFQEMKQVHMKVLDGAAELLFAAWELQWRTAEWMCELALEIEAALGLPPLPRVVTKDKKGDDVSQAASNAA